MRLVSHCSVSHILSTLLLKTKSFSVQYNGSFKTCFTSENGTHKFKVKESVYKDVHKTFRKIHLIEVAFLKFHSL